MNDRIETEELPQLRVGRPAERIADTFTGLSRRLIVPLLSQADFCFARDGQSLEFLRELGVKNKHLEFGPDATFGYESRDDRWAAQFMSEYGLKPRFAEAGRKAWMLRDLGVEKWLSDLDAGPAEKPIAALMDIHNDFDGALRDVNNAQSIVAQRQAETMAIVKAAVERGARRRA